MADHLGDAARETRVDTRTRSLDAVVWEQAATGLPVVPFTLRRRSDATLTWSWIGPASRPCFGLDPEEILRDPALLLDRIGAAERERLDALLADDADAGESRRMELSVDVAGEERSFEIVVVRRADGEEGELWHGVAIDLGERRRQEKELRLTQFSFDHASIGIYRIREKDGRIVAVNDRACRSLGYTAAELCRMTVFDIDPTFTPERWFEHRRQVRRKRSGTVESRHRRKDGTVFPVEVSVSYFQFAGEEYSFSFVRDITERKRAEAALRAEEAKYRSVVDNLGIGIVLIDRDMRVQSVNRALRERFPDADFDTCPVCYHVFRVPPRDWPCDHCVAAETFADGELHETVTEAQVPEGRRFFRVIASPIKDDAGEVAAVVELVEDITERLQAEHEREQLQEQLRQARKMESIGTLAGGIAHDFNNMLGVIIGYAELMKASVAAGDPLLDSIGEIEKAALRSRDTTSQLLAFSRRQTITPRPLDIGRHVAALEPTLQRLIGEQYALVLDAAPDLWTVRFDPSQLDQVLINLVVNARDAMPDGGAIEIALRNVAGDEPAGEELGEALLEDHVRLQVIDHGVGMSEETLSRIFEPFFTTKETGEGTGLGLAMVYGIVEQNGGHIAVSSRPGAGTTFAVQLPRIQVEAVSRGRDASVPKTAGAATILLVEDDPLVRRLASRMLRMLGHEVLDCASPQAALAACEDPAQAVDLLLTDVIMPEMNGAALRDRVQERRPGVKVLFMSGYSADVIGKHGVLEPEVAFLQKPFEMRSLARAVDEVLGQG